MALDRRTWLLASLAALLSASSAGAQRRDAGTAAPPTVAVFTGRVVALSTPPLCGTIASVTAARIAVERVESGRLGAAEVYAYIPCGWVDGLDHSVMVQVGQRVRATLAMTPPSNIYSPFDLPNPPAPPRYWVLHAQVLP